MLFNTRHMFKRSKKNEELSTLFYSLLVYDLNNVVVLINLTWDFISGRITQKVFKILTVG